MPQLERREALPVHPVPAGLAAPEDWRLRVDGLVSEPLDSVCERGRGPGSAGACGRFHL